MGSVQLSDRAPRTVVITRAQSRKVTNSLYSAFDEDPELKSRVVDLVGVERPTFEEFLSSIIGDALDRRVSNSATMSESATGTTVVAVPIKYLVAPVVDSTFTASVI